MYKFDKKIVPIDSSEQIYTGLYLWIWNPNVKSPHLGISLNGKYFSLQHQGKQENLNVEILLNVAKRQKNSALLIEIASNLNKTNIEQVFAKYTCCEVDQCSCSKPLFDLFDIQLPDGILFDLLENQKHSILALFGIQLESNFEGIPKYTYSDVLFNLNALAT